MVLNIKCGFSRWSIRAENTQLTAIFFCSPLLWYLKFLCCKSRQTMKSYKRRFFFKYCNTKCPVLAEEIGFWTSVKAQESQTSYRKNKARRDLCRSNYLISPLMIKKTNKCIFHNPLDFSLQYLLSIGKSYKYAKSQRGKKLLKTQEEPIY